MIYAATVSDIESWRRTARAYLEQGVRPEDVIWNGEKQASLFGETANVGSSAGSVFRVPSEFIRLAEAVACFDSPERWALLYRLLFRITQGQRNLLEIDSDPDVRDARLMAKAVSRDVHKLHAFVRFKEIKIEEETVFAAWHEPQHFTVERAVPFFVRRFGEMRFSIFTPSLCAHWDLKKLEFSPGVEKMALPDDMAEDFWLTYYRAIFNPFRLNVKAMKRELPVRHWKTLPEAVLIDELIKEAS